MTLCIKYNHIDFNKLTLNKKKTFDNNATVIYHPLNYNYDYNLNKKLYILTDWIDIDEFSYNSNKLSFYFINNDLDILFNKINNMITINNKSKKNNKEIDYAIDYEIDSDIDDFIVNDDNDDNYDNSDNDDNDDNKLKKKISNNKNNDDNNKIENKSIILDNLINLNKNFDNFNNLDEDIKKYTLNFNDKSSIKLIPSKKSGMEEYELNKKENYTEIKRYFPTINKKNTKYKIVGKFLLYINIFCFPNINININNIKIHIKSGELKYDKTFVKDDMLKSKGVYDDKIKIEI